MVMSSDTSNVKPQVETKAVDKHVGTLCVRDLGFREYVPVWQAMQGFTATRHIKASECDQNLPRPSVDDELWFVEHDPVFTLGHAADPSHVLAPGDIPVIEVDRGGQVTYHGPGQLVAYVMIDLHARKFGVRKLVEVLERSIIEVLSEYGIDAGLKDGAPGVYVEGRKIASVGLRVKRGCSYHGLSLNIDVDKTHFQRINPCGYSELEVVNLCELLPSSGVAGKNSSVELASHLKEKLCALLTQYLGYNSSQWVVAELPNS